MSKQSNSFVILKLITDFRQVLLSVTFLIHQHSAEKMEAKLMVEIEHLSDKAKQDLILVEAAKKGNQAA